MNIGTWVLVLLWIGCHAGPAVASDPRERRERPFPAISEESVLQTLMDMEAWGNRVTWEKQNAVADYLHRRLRRVPGLEVRFHHYQDGDLTYRNVVARIPGKKDPGSVLIFCAHYDSHPDGLTAGGRAPGVDDNATGVAVLLEGARMLAAQPVNRPVELVFFSNEEQGHKGSKAYVKDLAARGRRVQGVINIDAVGYAQPPLAALWRDALGWGSLEKWQHLARQALKKPVNYVKAGFRNPDGMLVVGGRPAHAAFAEGIHARLKKADIGVAKDIGPQCG
ncbi:MAG: M20/M25/M40 family metallo-hydrolase [Thermodesulfobacteriota bacterium]